MAKDREQFGGGHRRDKRQGVRLAKPDEITEIDDIFAAIEAEREEMQAAAERSKQIPESETRYWRPQAVKST